MAAMLDASERQAFVAMLDFDLGAVEAGRPLMFGPAGWQRHLAYRRFASTRRRLTCRCGYRCHGSFMEMHDCAAEQGRSEG